MMAGAAGMGLTAALLWGGSDFAGGVGARRAPALLVVLAGHLVTFLLLMVVCAGLRLPWPVGGALWIGVAAGFEGALSLAIFYRALAEGAMGATAAVTGVLTAAVPVGFALWREGWPGGMEWAGLTVGVAAIALVATTGRGEADGPATREPGASRRALMLGAMAGVGFGVQLVLLKLAAEGGVVQAMTTARAGGLVGVGVALMAQSGVRRQWLPSGVWRGFWRLGILAGVLDATGNGAYMLAAEAGRMEVGAMLASLYPVMTILLAAVVLGERPTRRQAMGMTLAAGAIVLLSR